jgi:drug/metabolite transporter (DMT)-like permease
LLQVCGAAFAYFFLGERWGPLGWVGALLIVVSCLATQLVGAEVPAEPSKHFDDLRSG